jgi:hypothetical protein
MKKGATIRKQRKSDKCVRCGKQFQAGEALTFDSWGRCSHLKCPHRTAYCQAENHRACKGNCECRCHFYMKPPILAKEMLTQLQSDLFYAQMERYPKFYIDMLKKKMGTLRNERFFIDL